VRLRSKRLAVFAVVAFARLAPVHLAAKVLQQAQAQDISGTWQGTLENGAAKLRLVLRVGKTAKGWNGTLLSIDQSPDWGAVAPVESINIQNGAIKIKIGNATEFEATLSADGISMTGAWIQGRRLPLIFQRATSETEWKDVSVHTTQFVTVDGDVQLEVLDWGGSGRQMLLRAGLGNTAHIFDPLASKLNKSFHVYGLTRRGFGASGAPSSGYGAVGRRRVGSHGCLKTQQAIAGRPLDRRSGIELDRFTSCGPGGGSDLSRRRLLLRVLRPCLGITGHNSARLCPVSS
jgi:hypothetical protein